MQIYHIAIDMKKKSQRNQSQLAIRVLREKIVYLERKKEGLIYDRSFSRQKTPNKQTQQATIEQQMSKLTKK